MDKWKFPASGMSMKMSLFSVPRLVLSALLLGVATMVWAQTAPPAPKEGQAYGPDGKIRRANMHLLFRQDDEPTVASFIHLGGGVATTMGQWSSRYGIFGEATGGYLFKTKSNWLIGADLTYQFGEDVKENSLGPYVNSDGNVVGNLGLYSFVSIQQRGVKLPILRVGRLFPVAQASWMDKQSSGPFITLGAGFWQHQMFIAVNSELQMLQGENGRGFDRMCQGIAGSATVGYMMVFSNRRFGAFGMLDFAPGITTSQRYDWDLRIHDTSPRYDASLALKVGIFLPLFPAKENELLFD